MKTMGDFEGRWLTGDSSSPNTVWLPQGLQRSTNISADLLPTHTSVEYSLEKSSTDSILLPEILWFCRTISTSTLSPTRRKKQKTGTILSPIFYQAHSLTLHIWEIEINHLPTYPQERFTAIKTKCLRAR